MREAKQDLAHAEKLQHMLEVTNTTLQADLELEEATVEKEVANILAPWLGFYAGAVARAEKILTAFGQEVADRCKTVLAQKSLELAELFPQDWCGWAADRATRDSAKVKRLILKNKIHTKIYPSKEALHKVIQEVTELSKDVMDVSEAVANAAKMAEVRALRLASRSSW